MNDKDNIFDKYLMQVSRPFKYEGRTEWQLPNGVVHRDDGPAIVYDTGTKAWYRYGVLHREDGPAWVSPTMSGWYKNGKRHRLDGPAYVYIDHPPEWFLNDEEIFDINTFARLSLKKQNKPYDPKSVQAFVKQLLANQVKDIL